MNANSDDSRPRSTLAQLRADGSASVDELREFLGDLKGKDPREVMGVIANSGLARSLIIATIGCIAILVAGTALPYALSNPDSEKQEVKTGKKRKGATTSNQQTKSTEATKQSNVADRAKSNKQKAVGKMGIGDSKKSDPSVNPLDNKLKNLLDGKK